MNLFNFLLFVQVNVGPFTIVKSVDALTEALADMLSNEQRDFTLSTNNVGNENATHHWKYLSVIRHCFCGDHSW